PRNGDVYSVGGAGGCRDHGDGGGMGATTLGPRGMAGDYGEWTEAKALPVGMGALPAGETSFYTGHWWYRSKNGKRVYVATAKNGKDHQATAGVGDDPSDCAGNQRWNPNTQQCEDVGPIQEACAPGYAWSHEYGRCIKVNDNPPPPPPPPPQPQCASDETYDAQQGKCVKKNAPPPPPSSSSSSGS